MRPVPARFLRTVTAPHTAVFRARVCSTWQTGIDPVGTKIDFLDGNVVLDGTADIRSVLNLTVAGKGMWPRRVADLLAPYGNELFIERGVQYNAGTIDYCSLGYFRLETPGQDNPPNGPIRIVAKDRMAGLVDARLLAPVQYLATATYGQVVTALVTDVYPGAVVEWDDSTASQTLDRSVIVEEDRYKFLNDLVVSRGKIWYWDHRGVLVIRTPPDVANPVAEVSAGEGGVLVSMSRQLTREGVYNAVVASGEGSDSTNPVRQVAIDDNPNSPTYFYGRFGKVPRFFSSSFLTSEAEASQAASTMLRTQLGLPYNVDFDLVPNPALEPFDPVRIRSASDQGAEVHVLETLTIPLVAEMTMTATTREQTTVLIGAA